MESKEVRVLACFVLLVIFAVIPLLAVFNADGALRPLDPDHVDLRLAWFYKPPDDGNLDPLVEHFSLFILTQGDEKGRDRLQEQGVRGPFLQYLHFETIQDPELCTDRRYCHGRPWGNQVAFKQGDFDIISRDHPDWFLRDTDGDLIIVDESFVMMDPGNPGWRAFFLERVREMQDRFGWRGVFLDNVEASLNKTGRMGIQLAAYPDKASYQAAVEGFLEYLYTGYFQPQGRPLYANIIELKDPDVWFRYLRFLDGAMDEAWAVDWADRYRPVEEWFEHLERAERTQNMGKQVILVSQGDEFDDARQEFALASYLLVNNGRAAFRYTDSTSYDQAWLYDNYNQYLGRPHGRSQCVLGQVCWRQFSGGTVIVLPQIDAATILRH